MRKTVPASRLFLFKPATSRLMRATMAAASIGLVLAAAPAKAQEDEEADDSTFEQRIIRNLMSGIGAKSMEDRGITYRERSPLVVPRSVDQLPAPEQRGKIAAPNWPKDPDVIAREQARLRAKENPGAVSLMDSARPLTPAEMEVGRIKGKKRQKESVTPGDPVGMGNPMLSPSQLGYTGGLFKSWFGGGDGSETAKFDGEPTRENLTQPPPGYQTPSPNYAYGTGPQESLNKEYNPVAGKYGD